MMSISTMATSGCRFQQRDRFAPGGGGQHMHAAPLQHARQREDVAGVVVDQQHLPPDQVLVGAGQPVEHSLLLLRQFGDDPVQEQRRFVEQALRRLDALDHDAARHRVQLRVLLGGQLAPGEHHHGNVRERNIVADLLEHVEAGHIRQPEIEHDAIARLVAEDRQRVLALAGGDDLDVVVAEQARGCSSARLRCLPRPAGAFCAAMHIP